jgi:protein involved in polysaccharide export with SLBB domain
MPHRDRTISTVALLFSVLAALAGCTASLTRQPDLPSVAPPRESVHIAQATERIKPGDLLTFRLPDEPKAPINGLYQVAADGTIALTGEGRVQVGNKTLDEARQMLRSVLSVSYAVQTMELTPYEFYMVRVKGDDVKKPIRVPLKDGVTVKEALLGAPPLGDKIIWIRRSNPGTSAADELLAVDWNSVNRDDKAPTNYKLRCGDYLFVADKPPNLLQQLLDPGITVHER